ncbi:MAG: hypothetical protein HY547_04405 [Elusimicrobia bacterium]|nr:hypothetical protein [Elusimicrobiota bacterium]
MDEVLYERVFKALAKHRVRYLTVGGVAVNLLGIPRFTKDLDLMLDLERKNVMKVVMAMKELGYRPRSPVKSEYLADAKKRQHWIKDKGALVFTFQNSRPPHDQVDVFLENPINFRDAYLRKKVFSAKGLRISVVALVDLLKLKAKAGRLQDRADIAMLRKIYHENS